LTNVLPLLLQERSQKVGSKLSVDNDILFGHFDVSNGNVQAHDLLHLELDGSLNLVDLLLHVIVVSQKGRELTRLGKTGTKKTRNLLDHVVGGQEEIVFLGELLHQLLVLVKLLQVLNSHVVDADTIGLFAMGGISKNAALESGTGNLGQPESTGETLVTDGIVVLQGDLSFDRFGEVTLLAFLFFTANIDGLTGCKGEDILDSLVEEGGVELRHGLKE